MAKMNYAYKNSIKDFSSFAMIDDLLVTGGTVGCVAKLLKSQKIVVGLGSSY